MRPSRELAGGLLVPRWDGLSEDSKLAFQISYPKYIYITYQTVYMYHISKIMFQASHCRASSKGSVASTTATSAGPAAVDKEEEGLPGKMCVLWAVPYYMHA